MCLPVCDFDLNSTPLTPPSPTIPNPPHSQGLVHLKSSREKAASDIEQLENEKAEIESTLPVLLSRLLDLGGSVDYLTSEKAIYTETIDRMSGSFGVILEPGGERAERQLGQGEEDRRFGGPGDQVIRDLQVIAARYKREEPYAEEGEEGSEAAADAADAEEDVVDEEREEREWRHELL